MVGLRSAFEEVKNTFKVVFFSIRQFSENMVYIYIQTCSYYTCKGTSHRDWFNFSQILSKVRCTPRLDTCTCGAELDEGFENQ